MSRAVCPAVDYRRRSGTSSPWQAPSAAHPGAARSTRRDGQRPPLATCARRVAERRHPKAASRSAPPQRSALGVKPARRPPGRGRRCALVRFLGRDLAEAGERVGRHAARAGCADEQVDRVRSRPARALWRDVAIDHGCEGDPGVLSPQRAAYRRYRRSLSTAAPAGRFDGDEFARGTADSTAQARVTSVARAGVRQAPGMLWTIARVEKASSTGHREQRGDRSAAGGLAEDGHLTGVRRRRQRCCCGTHSSAATWSRRPRLAGLPSRKPKPSKPTR